MEELTTDVLVVGSGPVGSTYARILTMADPRLSVTVIDAGPQESKVPGANVKNTYIYNSSLSGLDPLGDAIVAKTIPVSVPADTTWPATLNPISQPAGPPSDYRRNLQNPDQQAWENLPGAVSTFSVGGMAGHWTCATPRPYPVMEKIPFIPLAEWDTLLDLAEVLLNTHHDTFAPSLRGRVIKRVWGAAYDHRLPPGYGVTDLPMAAERLSPTWVQWTGADTVLGPLAASDFPTARFRILDNHLCRELHRATDGHVAWAEVEHLTSGGRLAIRAGRFVVAANSFNTPQVLWVSGIRPAPLGRYLTDQTTLFTHVVLDPEIVAQVAAEWDPPPNDPVPIPERDPIPQVLIPYSYPEHPFNAFVQRDAFPFPSPGLNLGDILGGVDQRLVVGCFWFSPNEQRWENHLSFSSTNADLLGMPQITFHYSLSETDRALAQAALEDMTFAARLLGGSLPSQEPQFLAPGSSYHYMGTFRMGESSGDSVCDPLCRMWGFDNLHLGGNGIIPTPMACNTTLSAVALAVRGAATMAGLSLDQVGDLVARA